MTIDSNEYIKRADDSLNRSYNAEMEVFTQRHLAQASANALIAIAKELQAIRKIVEKTEVRRQAWGNSV